MPYVQQYTFLDGKWHAIGWSEHTQCNLEIPFGNGYGPLPDKAKAHCGPDTKIAEDSTDDDPAANKAIADEEAAKRAGVPLESVTGEAAEEYLAEPEPAKPASKPAAKATKKGGKVV